MKIERVKNEIVRHNVRMLTGKEWVDAAARESIGGNAGPNHLAVNAVVRDDGAIIKFSNYPRDYSGFLQATFRVDISPWFRGEESIIDEVFFDGEFTEEAIRNIISAVEIRNELKQNKF